MKIISNTEELEQACKAHHEKRREHGYATKE